MEGIVHAGFWRRAAALLVDLALISFLLWLVGLVIGGWSQRWTIVEWGTAGRAFAVDPIAALLFLAYFVLPEAMRTRATPGKRWLGLKVARADGRRIDSRRALARGGLKLLTILTLGLGFLLAAVTRRKQALHDLLSNCTVIRAGAAG
jgi:uncharacterized RDD family membrane protein YckC